MVCELQKHTQLLPCILTTLHTVHTHRSQEGPQIFYFLPGPQPLLDLCQVIFYTATHDSCLVFGGCVWLWGEAGEESGAFAVV